MPVITPLYAALAAAVMIVLSLRVIGMRRGRRVSIGDGGDDDLARRIRAQGNFAEYTPLALLLILLLELGGAPAWQLHLLGAALSWAASCTPGRSPPAVAKAASPAWS